MKTSTLPPPCLPTSENVSMGIGIPNTTFIPHAKRDDWEYNGTESMIRLTEIKIAFTDARGWGTNFHFLSLLGTY
jgi:hypothetical protein